MAAAVGLLMGTGGLWLGLIAPAAATGEGDTCPKDSVRSGSLCIDKYEASVWRVPDPTGANKGLVRKIRQGRATVANLTTGGATQLGTAGDDYGAGCPDTGNGCGDVYAVSIPGVTPSTFLTWFQAAAAARNAGKRLPSNAEWQAAARGTPDGAPCIVNAFAKGPTGTAGCVSDVRAFDMVGNVQEWVADWVPRATACVPPLFPDTGDSNCLAGADDTSGRGALVRGGNFLSQTLAGVFSVVGSVEPSGEGGALFVFGFRAAR